jgi:hypothetical protein
MLAQGHLMGLEPRLTCSKASVGVYPLLARTPYTPLQPSVMWLYRGPLPKHLTLCSSHQEGPTQSSTTPVRVTCSVAVLQNDESLGGRWSRVPMVGV